MLPRWAIVVGFTAAGFAVGLLVELASHHRGPGPWAVVAALVGAAVGAAATRSRARR